MTSAAWEMAMTQFEGEGLSARLGADAFAETIARAEAESEIGRGAEKARRLAARAAKAWSRHNVLLTARLALRATEADEKLAIGYHLLAMALERMGHTQKALLTYEMAHKLAPDDPELMLNLGLLAWKLKMHTQSAALFIKYMEMRPDCPLGPNNLGSVLYELGDGPAALETLRSAIYRMPQYPVLWNALATILAEMGRAEEGLVFYQEAISLDPAYPRSWHNLGYALMHLGRLDEALKAYDAALARADDPEEAREGRHSRSICLIGMGRLEEGFTAYECRTEQEMRDYTHYMVQAPRWRGEPLKGKKLLLIAEQGLGDEIMFANTVPDFIRAVGPEGRVQVAVAGRLVTLFQRSFPAAEVGSYDDRIISGSDAGLEVRFVPFAMDSNAPNYYVPMGSTLMHVRKRIEDFPRQPFLTPDPARVAHFRQLLGSFGEGPLVGICWRSMLPQVRRQKYFSALEMWGPILKTPGVTFVNLQYGDCAEELEAACAQHGVVVHCLPGLDLKRDLDGATALSSALDLVISAPTAAAALSAGAGVETWFLTAGRTWPQLGTDCYPWYRAAPVFSPERFGDWHSLMPIVGSALAQFVARRKAA